MRKDVKIGLSIGAVLLVVLVAYFVVRKDKPKQLAVTDGQDSTTTGDYTSTGADAPGEALAADGGAAAPESLPPATETPRYRAENTADTGNSTGRSAASNAAAGISDGSGTGGGADWLMLLNPGAAPTAEQTSVTPEFQNAAGSSAQATGAATPGVSTAVRSADVSPASDAFAAPGGAVDAFASPTASTTYGGSAAAAALPTTPQVIAPVGGLKTHVMQRGESFWTVSKLVYGDGKYYRDIEDANPTLDAKAIRPGVTINLPSIERRQRSASVSTLRGTMMMKSAPLPSAAVATDPKRQYTVQPGDSLYKIAMKLYGKGSRHEDLYSVNRDKIGSDPSRVKVGMVLQLPDPPTVAASR